MTSSLPSGTGLQVMSVTAFAFIVFSILSLYFLFTQMDMSRMAEFSNKLELVENVPDGEKSVHDKDNDDTPQRRYLTQYRRIVLMLTVAVITILVYLILVFSNAPLWLEWIGMLIVLVLLGPILQYGDEIRRQRYDRLSLMVSLVFILALGLNLAVYASSQYANEDIYKGPARIIGYEDDNYNNAQGDTVTRTDLTIAWGGDWGCPHNPGQYCEAKVPGALCDSTMYNYRRHGRRKLEDVAVTDDYLDTDDTSTTTTGTGTSGGSSATTTTSKNNTTSGTTNNENQSYSQLQQDYADLEQQYEDLQDRYNNLQQQNEDLQNDLQAYENAYNDLEEEEEEYIYYWEDDYFYDAYWDEQDWTSVWGDYQCTEMFEYDLTGSTYEENTPPGEDGWPYLQVYGNCDTCDAFIVDFYSTEHFQEISSYKDAAVHYAMASIVTSLVTVALALKHRFSPQAENEIELLPSAGSNGAMA